MSEEEEDVRIVRVTGWAVEDDRGCGKMYLPASWIGKKVVVELKEEADS